MSKFYGFFLIALILGACSSEPTWQLHGSSMGTNYHIVVVPKDTTIKINKKQLQIQVMQTLEELESQMSTYREDSDLMRFNRGAINQWLTVEAHTFKVAVLSKQFYELSNGHFDAAMGSLVELWGFGASEVSMAKLPNAKRLQNAHRLSGSQFLEIHKNKMALKKIRAIQLDFSAIAKGYAVDRLAELMDSYAIQHYLIELGGELSVKGSNKRDNAWHIGIVQPKSSALESNNVHRSLYLSKAISLATSGDYQNYIIIDGERFSHTINPTTGMPIKHDLASVTVLHSSAAAADAWATALNVMGSKRGIAFANEHNLAALFLQRNQHDQELVTYVSTVFQELNL